MTDIQLDNVSFYKKLQKISDCWNQEPTRQDALIFVLGKVKDEPERPLTSDFFLWLLNWEFSDTLLIIQKDKIVFAVSPKKAKLLREMKPPQADYSGPKLVVIETVQKVESAQQTVDKVFSSCSDMNTVANYLKDKDDGDLTKATLNMLKTKGAKIVELKDFMDKVHVVKTQTEIKNLDLAGKFTQLAFTKIVDEVEDIIENNGKVKHSAIQKRIEALLDNTGAITKFNKAIDPQFLDFPLPVLIQSGGDFNINKFQLESNNNILQSQAIYINCCGKYCDMSAMASRTLMVNPVPEQKQTYLVCLEAQKLLINSLKAGQKIGSAYQTTQKFIKAQNPNLSVHQNFGFGIGFNFKEDLLTIQADNQMLIQQGMTFHVRVAVQNVHKDPSRSVIAIGDTVVISESGDAEVITADIQKGYEEISYSLADSEDEAPKQKAKAPAATKKKEESSDEEEPEEGSKEILVQGRTGASVIKSSRLRSKADTQKVKQSEIEERKQHQAELYEEKQKQLKIRFERGEIQTGSKKEKVKKMVDLNCYKNMDGYPKDLVPGQIYVDTKRNAVLIPNSATTFIPFHVSTIRSVNDTIQGQWTYLRINFHVTAGPGIQFPPMEDPNNILVKQLTLKCKSTGANNRLSQVSKQIKECIKNAKTQQTETEVKAAQNDAQLEQLTMLKSGRKEQLDNLVIRPNIVGKKTIGSLEIHQNGLRFIATKGEKVDICFSNIKHCFYQPCAADELLVMIHFNLKAPIMLGTKKVTDVQFCKESGVAAEDINFGGGRHKRNDMDELEQEEAERQARKRLNSKFLGFAKLIEQQSQANRTQIEVDIPEESLQFYGNPGKTLVRIRPTKNCLVALSELPFFVLDTNDIELVCFERVYFGIKNFDLAIIFKDFQTFKRIDSIPIEYFEELKSYFDSIDVIFAETNAPFKWNQVLQEMRENFVDYLENGVWSFLLSDESDEGEQGEEEAEESDPDVEFQDEDLESEYSESDSEFSNEDSSEMASEDQLSDEGLSWDELDRQAEEEDRKNATRRQPEKSKGSRAPTGRRK